MRSSEKLNEALLAGIKLDNEIQRKCLDDDKRDWPLYVVSSIVGIATTLTGLGLGIMMATTKEPTTSGALLIGFMIIGGSLWQCTRKNRCSCVTKYRPPRTTGGDGDR